MRLIFRSTLIALAVCASAFGSRALAEDLPIFGNGQPFAVRGKQYRVFQKHNENGILTEQILYGPDRVVISSDPHGQGWLDSWQLIEAHRAVLMHDPSGGNFLFMDVSEETPKGRLELKYILSKSGSYRLLSANRRPLRTLHDAYTTQDFVVGCKSMEVGLQEQAAQIDKELQTQGNASAFRSVVQNTIMDSRCNDPKSAFAGSINDMLGGIMEVATSDPSWNFPGPNQPAAPAGASKSSSGAGSFLKCLRDHKLDAHASRIESAFGNYLSLVDKTAAKGSFDWHITCQLDGKGGGMPTDPVNALSAYLPVVNGPPTIVFYKTTDKMPRVADHSAADSYAQAFFHEMIHYSLIADEVYDKQMELCCSFPPDQKMPTGQYAGQSSCSALDQTVQAKLYAQKFETAVANMTKSDNLVDLRERLRQRLGTGADIMIDQFQTEVGTDYAKYKANPKCNGKDGGLSTTCEAAFKADLKTDFGFLMTDCASVTKDYGMQPEDSGSYCGALGLYEQRLLGLDTSKVDQSSICKVKKKTAANGESPNDDALTALFAKALEHMARWLNWSPNENAALADDDISSPLPPGNVSDAENIQLLCSEAEQVHSVWPTFATTPGNFTLQPQVRDVVDQQIISSAVVGNDATSQTPSTGDHEVFKTPGPQPSEISNVPSTREHQIVAELDRQDSLFGKASSTVTERLARTVFVPTANAAESSSRVSPPPAQATSAPPSAPLPTLSYPQGSRVPASLAGASLPTSLPRISVPSPIDFSTPAAHPPSPYLVEGPVAPPNWRSLASVAVAAAPPVGAVPPGNASAGGSQTVILQNRYVTNAAVTNPTGAGAAGGLSPLGTAKKPATRSAADERALLALLAFLQRPYRDVRPELIRPSVIDSMKRHLVQAVDDEGLAHGSGFPEHHLLYDRELDRLVLTDRKSGKAHP